MEAGVQNEGDREKRTKERGEGEFARKRCRKEKRIGETERGERTTKENFLRRQRKGEETKGDRVRRDVSLVESEKRKQLR